MPQAAVEAMILPAQNATLMLIFCVGYTAVFVIFGLLYQHAWELRAALQLDAVESVRTAQARAQHFGFAAVGVLVASPRCRCQHVLRESPGCCSF